MTSPADDQRHPRTRGHLRLQIVTATLLVASLTVLGGTVVRPDFLRSDAPAPAEAIIIPTTPPEPGQPDPRAYLLPGNLPAYVPAATPDPTQAAPQSVSPPAAGESTAAPAACDHACVQIGAATEEFPGDWDALAAFSELSGRELDIVAFFQAWGDADREFKSWLPQLGEMGVTPLITWEPWTRGEGNTQSDITLQAIVDGRQDAYVDGWAAQAAAYGGPIYIRFAHEMNTPPGTIYWYPWQGDPNLYVKAWQHVHDRFVSAGATNVRWVWSPAWMNDDALLYYPGPDYVDWVAMTILNFGSESPESGWRSFEQLYNPQHARAARFGKPIMLSEVGSAEQGGDKGAWIASIGPSLQYNFPEVRALVWMNYAKARQVDTINWRVDSSPQALAGWRQLTSYPYVAD
jgi:hypothetical protein